MVQTIRLRPLESNDEEEFDRFDHVIAIIRYGMRLLGFWPQDTQLLYNLLCSAIFVLIGFSILPSAIQTYNNIMVYKVTDWSLVLHQTLYLIPIIPVLTRFIFMKVMARNLRVVLQTMTDDWANYRYLAKQSRRIMIYYAKKCRRFSIINTVLLILSLTGITLTPIVNMWRSDGFRNESIRMLPLEGFYPFHDNESPMYEILYVAQSFSMIFIGIAVTTVDCFLYIIVFHVCGQFHILAANLKHYNSSIRHRYITDVLNCSCISCIVKRHVHILSIVDLIEKSFRDFLLVHLLGYWIYITLLGHELILHLQHNNIYGIITTIIIDFTIMYYLFIYCYISEYIIEKSENIGKIAHNLEWQRFPRDSNLPIIVARTRIPCKLTAGRFFTLSFPFYTKILGTTISYISVLVALK